jgi:aldehyde:ferredoxin oxidoreductase
MSVVFPGSFLLLDFINAVVGWDMTIEEAVKTGARIQTLRHMFNIREGVEPAKHYRLPDRMAGIPPKSEGPLKNITIDIDSLAREYRKAMGWDPDSGQPTKATLAKLGLKELTKKYA